MNQIIIDTLTISFKFDNVANLIEQLNLAVLNMEPSRNRFYNAGEYYPGINLMYNLDENYQVTDCMLHLSGKGCRLVEQLNPSFDWFEFLYQYDEQIRNRDVHISRIDVACDILDGSLKIGTIQKYSRQELYVCKSKILPDVRYMRTEEVYFGSPRSNRLLRIYDKALEQGIPDTDWLRIEFQLRNENATSWYLTWVQHRDVGKLFAGYTLDYLRFVSPPRGTSIKLIKQHSNQHRLPTAKWWLDFIGEAERIPQLYLPGEDFTIERLDRYLEHHNASSLKAYIIAHEGDVSKLIHAAEHANLNVRQKLLLDKLRLMKIELDKESYEYEKQNGKTITTFN